MEKAQINPWSWQDARGFSQAWVVRQSETTLYVSGQVSVSDTGELVGAGDFETQATQVFENLRRVLEEGGATFENVVKVTVFLTDMTHLPIYSQVKARYMAGPQPASVAIGVTSLAQPGYLLEVEAIAVM